MWKCLFLVLVLTVRTSAQNDSPDSSRPDSTFYKCGFGKTFPGTNILDVAELTDEANVEDIFKAQFNLVFSRIENFSGSRYPLKASDDHDTYAWVSLIKTNTSVALPFKSILYYRQDSIKSVIERFGISYELWGMIIHEIGHLVRQDAFFKEESIKCESKADEFLGFHARSLFTSVDQATAAIEKLIPDKPEEGYPTKKERIQLVKNGWEDAAPSRRRLSPIIALVEKEGKFKATGAIKKANDFSKFGVIESSWPVASFPKFPNAKFSLSPEATLVYQDEEGILTIGEIKKSILPNYALSVIDNYFQQLFIDNEGKIFFLKGDKASKIGEIERTAFNLFLTR